MIRLCAKPLMHRQASDAKRTTAKAPPRALGSVKALSLSPDITGSSSFAALGSAHCTRLSRLRFALRKFASFHRQVFVAIQLVQLSWVARSEERRVGKEC